MEIIRLKAYCCIGIYIFWNGTDTLSAREVAGESLWEVKRNNKHRYLIALSNPRIAIFRPL